jgi:15-cis-phytoene desaturase
MEGAVFGGKLAAEVVAKKAKGMDPGSIKDIQPEIVQQAQNYTPRDPPGVKGDGAIAFGGGASFTENNAAALKEVDPAQFVA